MDSLELGLSAADKGANANALRQGIDLALNKLSAVLSDFGVEIIDPQGELFDPAGTKP